MKVLTTPQDFTSQALALLKARPTTAKVSTSYHASTPGKGRITLKCFDPVSGAVIKYSTHRIADVGRVIGSLNRLAREQTRMSEPAAGDSTMLDSPAVGTPAGATTPIPGGAATTIAAAVLGDSMKGKGKKKKGKGKK